jgi:hypothetical protein
LGVSERGKALLPELRDPVPLAWLGRTSLGTKDPDAILLDQLHLVRENTQVQCSVAVSLLQHHACAGAKT